MVIAGSKCTHTIYLLMLIVERYNPSFEYIVAKRIGDSFLSLIALVIASSTALVTATYTKAEDHGPALFKQCRLTKVGKEFFIYKFHSMRTDAEKDGVARLSTVDNDDRITKDDHFIRKVRIDELLQLVNKLRGDLSIVEPRAERPELAREYEEKLPEFTLRLQAKAELTRYAQVYGKYNTTPYEKLFMDLMYMQT